MDSTINGKKRSLPDGTTLLDLLKEAGVTPAQVVVEHNGAIVERSRLADVRLSRNDTVEIVHFVGGG